ncbi:MAG: serine protease Do [Acidobacteriaceae bacterium]|jgi:S1-C subfamily serine protease/DNA-binding response OmpR family regulator|nr:serine protease Do [Acidobacteriaceae bacterium]MDQ1404501.1 serine protease Do [Acidobacteriaceae bacterium]
MPLRIEYVMRVLILNLRSESLEATSRALSGQGYEVLTETGLTVEQVLALSPEVLVTEVTPSDLSCCALVTQLKSRPDTESPLKIVILVEGGALERARALDLGADDAISFPFEPVEFAARIRAQFRERKPQEELNTMLKYAVQREHFADIAVESLGGPVAKRRLWMIPAILVLSAAALIAAVYLGISGRGTRKETRQLRAEITRLSSSVGQQGDFQRRTEFTRGVLDAQSKSASATRESLKAQSADLNKRVARGGSDADSLKHQLADTQNRLKLLESEGKIAENVVQTYGPSVCLLHVVVEFLDKESGRPIQVAVDSAGKPLVDAKGMVTLDEGGPGPHLQIDVFGTGFPVKRDGKIITNHHVVEPWWKDDDLKKLLDQGATAYVLSYEVYFPGKAEGVRAKLDRISPKADLATLQLEAPLPPKTAVLELDDRTQATVTGDAVVLIGYPTGIEGILARAGSDVSQKIINGTPDVNLIMSQLASQHLIRPTTTQGHIGDVLDDKIVYDAATTSGGSGGPLFNRDGKVIGINFAVLRDFGGSNLAVPVKYAKDLLR